ncbi:MAG: tyrosine--tRNA ligase [Patescibacteria group bacterium]|nr:tyrosine--tRNA ligase [Patescibacteria group bacterium]
MNLYSELKERGLIYQVSDEENVKKLLGTKGANFYIGFDPTAESLHIGNLLQIIFMKRLEKAGLKPIALIGGGTGLIGDPSGKSNERQLNKKDAVKKMTDAVKKQLGAFFDLKKIKLVNNYDWLKELSVLDFLRNAGKNFSINFMLAKDSVKTRLEAGISFAEFSYMILQACDFLNLYKKYGCKLQVGGSDQWGNITAGIELIRKTNNDEVFGLTIPLLIDSDGKKMGKSEKGTVWLNPKLTSPYHFYQFWFNADDKDVIKFLKFFTFLPLDKIAELEKSLKSEPEKRLAQKELAKELAIFVHGEKSLKTVQKISEHLFEGKIKNLNKNEIEQIFSGVEKKEIEKFDKINVVDFLVLAEISSSKRQAREDIESKAIEINGVKITDINYIVKIKDFLFDKYIIAKRGKKDYNFILIK